MHYIADFRKQITPHFQQWVGGSFVTKKESPRDIDFVTLIDAKIYEEKEAIIDLHFRGDVAKENYGVDAFTLRVYPEKHRNFILTESDMIYWYNHWISNRKDQYGQRSFKGFIELKY